MGWARCDDQYYRHGKIVRAGRDARDYHWASIQHCCRELTDGLVECEFMRTILIESMAEKPIQWILDRLVEHRLFDLIDGEYWVHDFLDYNRSAVEEEERIQKRAEAGRLGGIRSGEARRAKQNEASASADALKPEREQTKQKRTPVPVSPFPSPRTRMYKNQVPENPPDGGATGTDLSTHASKIDVWRMTTKQLAEHSADELGDSGSVGLHVRVWNHARKHDRGKPLQELTDGVFSILTHLTDRRRASGQPQGRAFTRQCKNLFESHAVPLAAKFDPDEVNEVRKALADMPSLKERAGDPEGGTEKDTP